MKELIHSPLVLNSNATKLIETFSAERIISNYEKLGLHVDRFFDSESLYLFECLKTGYRFYYPFKAIGDADFYKDLSLNRANYYSERWEHKQALKSMNEGDIVLEIGSGFGLFLKMLKFNNISGSGLELNPHAVQKCVDEGLDVRQKLVQDLDNNILFDKVCFFQVLEHIAEVHSFIEAAINVLKVGGKLIIGVPNNNPYLFRYDKYHTLNLPPHHAGLWNKRSLTSLEKVFPLKLESMNFEPLNLTYDYFLNIQLKSSHSGLEKFCIKLLNKLFPKFLKRFLCKFYKGRNVLAVFTKT
ncbi:class I SAM-dependent methyltransferase [Yeosuana marina]|uniref:class I SAM-dependent methyltransferase n=1 Tax=Yeosuana marina TaxID=1565536 RepID=UPI0030C7B83B